MVYNRAGQSIDGLNEDIVDIYNEDGLFGIKKIKGVGEIISKEVEKIINEFKKDDDRKR